MALVGVLISVSGPRFGFMSPEIIHNPWIRSTCAFEKSSKIDFVVLVYFQK